MVVSGVQRYGREILPLLGTELESELRVIVPPGHVLEAGDPRVAEIAVSTSWHGIRGHLWEQLELPRLARRVGARALWSPCSWGPVAVRRQVPVIHDIAPLTRPEYFTRPYRALARTLTPPLVRRSPLVVTPSTRVSAELLERFELEPAGVQVVPPGVGEPFSSYPLDDLQHRRSGHCVVVGAHDSRKNVEFLLRLWPEVNAATGLELHLTYRSIATTRRLHPFQDARVQGIVVHADPTDEALARLYADALCLLWPSHYEGYGFPLLESMAVGTPFVSTDVGAAAELAIAPDEQVLPLDPARWRDRIVAWSSADIVRLREASARRARRQTWTAAAAETARILDRVALS
jgi:glycosyltransferase involved in cell wall biosynthesis